MRSVVIVAAVAVCPALVSCSDDNSTSSPAANTATDDAGGSSGGMAEMQMVEPTADTKALLAKTSDYKTWTKFAENATPVASESHMKMFVVTYHNTVVGDAVTSKTLPLPDGAIIVKENYPTADAQMPMALTIMSKQSGSWYWAEVTPDGKVVVDAMMDKGKPLEGTDVKMCVSCHTTKKDNDWVFVHDFKK